MTKLKLDAEEQNYRDLVRGEYEAIQQLVAHKEQISQAASAMLSILRDREKVLKRQGAHGCFRFGDYSGRELAMRDVYNDSVNRACWLAAKKWQMTLPEVGELFGMSSERARQRIAQFSQQWERRHDGEEPTLEEVLREKKNEEA